MRGNLFLTMHQTQVALWVCISFLLTGLFAETPLHAQTAPSEHPTDHTPQSEFFPPSPTPSHSEQPTGSATPSQQSSPSANSPSSQFTEEPPPQRIDLSQFPATAVDEVVVPLPSEIFSVLDKVGTPDWKEELPPTSGKTTGDRAQVALLLGEVIANGFIAVELEDSEKVKNIGREVLNLAGAINVRKAVITRANSITNKANSKEWPAVRREFDGALQDVRTAMQELNDNDLAQLVSLGGWLRGTEVLTSIVKKDYNPQAAGLLYQPELINYFLRRIDSMPRRLQQSQYVANIRRLLFQIRPLIAHGSSEVIPKQNVEQIHKLTHEAVQLFTPP